MNVRAAFYRGFALSGFFRRFEAMKLSTRSITRAAMIAALYCVLTLLFQPISYGPVQFRVSEALTLLPVFTADAVPGLFIGCLLANLLGGALWYDVVFGALATLLAALCTRRLRSRPALGEDRHAADDVAAGLFDQRFEGAEGFAGGDHVVHDHHALAAHVVGVGAVEVEGLLVVGGDGAHLGGEDVLHVELRTLAGEHIPLVAQQARHLADQRNALGFGGDQHVVLGTARVQRGCAGGGQLGVAEDHERADLHRLADRAQGQTALKARDGHRIGFLHFQNTSFGFDFLPLL